MPNKFLIYTKDMPALFTGRHVFGIAIPIEKTGTQKTIRLKPANGGCIGRIGDQRLALLASKQALQ